MILQGLLGDRAGHLSKLTLVWDRGATIFITSPELQLWVKDSIQIARHF